jgi:hypothetical protein
LKVEEVGVETGVPAGVLVRDGPAADVLGVLGGAIGL